MSLKATVLFLTHIVFALLASVTIGLFVGTVVVFVVAVVLIVFAVCIKDFRQLLRLVSIA
jgi:hypothetical protein